MWDFSLASYDSAWAVVIQLLLILVFLIIGNTLRRSIPFLRKAYIPSALLGGLLLLLLNIFLKNVCHVKLPGMEYEGIIDRQVMQVITYHALALGFIAMTLKVNKRENKKDGTGLKAFQNGALTGATYMLQAVFGLLGILIFFWAGKEIFYGTGILLPLSFGQGPGNAMVWGSNYSNPNWWSDIGIVKSASDLKGVSSSFGLSLASIGFIVASIVGVIYINIHRRSGAIVRKTTDMTRHVNEFVDENEIEDNESVDKLSVQVGIVAVAYAITFGIMALCSLNPTTNSMAWGFNFIFGVISATLVKFIINLLQKKKLMHRRYINNYQMDRISGFSFDLMIIAGVAAIEINEIKGFILPLIILSIIGTIVTYIYVRLITKLCFKGYEHEMFLTNFGTLTGTASNGMILLREIDPNYSTPASNVFIISQFPAMVMVLPLILLLKFAVKSVTNVYIAIGIFALLFIGYTAFIILSCKKEKNKK